MKQESLDKLKIDIVDERSRLHKQINEQSIIIEGIKELLENN
jgi:hypothetical protein